MPRKCHPCCLLSMSTCSLCGLPLCCLVLRWPSSTDPSCSWGPLRAPQLPMGRKRIFKEESWHAYKLSWHEVCFPYFSFSTEHSVGSTRADPPSRGAANAGSLEAGGPFSAQGMGGGGPRLTWVDGRIIATGWQGGPLPALPLLLHLFFQYQLS